MSDDYRKFPPDAPSERGLWILAAVLALLIVAHVIQRVTG